VKTCRHNPDKKTGGFESMLFGYARVSTNEQNTAVQIESFKRAGVQRVHEEKKSAIKDRPVLKQLLNEMQAGDVLVVYKLDRLARSMPHFVRVFEVLRSKGIGFRSLTEAIETDTPQGRMFLNLLGVFAEFEREMIRERCMAGQVAARARGQKWGRVASISPEDGAGIASMWRSGWFTQAQLAEMFGVTVACMRDTIHRAEDRGRWVKRRLQR
jgi:DNA invertase Pin-like site-specific DNA recombinase